MIASIISLVISLAVIFGLRQSDKKQSSLEKTKRYADKLHSEFEEYYAQRSKDLRTISDELRSETTQSIATVKRLEELSNNYQASCDDIAEKHGIISKLSESMTDANAKFQQVLDMSNLVEANIKNIREESKFVEVVSNDLKRTHNELETIQRDFTNMRDNFQEENNKILEKAKQNVLQTISAQLDGINASLADSRKEVDALLDDGKAKLNNIYKSALAEAVENANKLEGEAFDALKKDSDERMKICRRELDDNVRETEELTKRFKSAWQDEASGMLAKMQNDFTETSTSLNNKLEQTDKRVSALENEILIKTKNFDDLISESEKNFKSKISTTVDNLNNKISQLSSYTESRLNNVKEQTEYRFTKFDATVKEFQNSEATLKALLAGVKQKIMSSFEAYKIENGKNLSAFTDNFNNLADGLNSKVFEIEDKIKDLKDRSYETVSQKLKDFEEKFFTDINEKENKMQATIGTLEININEKLEEMSSKQESTRQNLEKQYTDNLQSRLLQLANSHKEKLSAFDKQIKNIEENLTERLAAQSINIQNVTKTLKEHVKTAKENAKSDLQKEMEAYMKSLQDSIINNKQDMEESSKKLEEEIKQFEDSYTLRLETESSNFQDWKDKLDKQFDSARNLFNDKISSFGQLAEAAIKDFEKQHDSDMQSFKDKNSEAFKKIESDLVSVTNELDKYKLDFSSFSDGLKIELNSKAIDLSNNFDKIMQDKIENATNKVDLVTKNMEHIKSQIEKNQSESFSLIQSESMKLRNSMQELNEKQKEYLSNTKLFERTDQLKAELEENIKALQDEFNKLRDYEASLDDVKSKYESFSKQNEETLNKIENFMQEKSKIELLQQEFSKLAELSKSIERKQIELEASNDEMQKYQIQIKNLDQSIAEINTKYSELDEKGDVLNQTIKDIDEAFSNISSIDKQFRESRRSLENLNPEISKLQAEMDKLIKNRSEINEIIEKINALDNMQSDVEDRMKSLQNSKEWLAGVESRLKSLDETITQRIKLFATVYNANDKKPREPNTSLSLSDRQNIIDLYRMNWTSQQIADAMKCTISEVELIIEISDKYTEA